MRRKACGSPSGPTLVALFAVAALIAAVGSSSPDGQLQAQQTQPQQQPLQQASGKTARRAYRGDFLLSATCNTVLRAERARAGTTTTGFPCVCVYLQLFVPSVPRLGDQRGEEVFLLSLLPLPPEHNPTLPRMTPLVIIIIIIPLPSPPKQPPPPLMQQVFVPPLLSPFTRQTASALPLHRGRIATTTIH